jgi:hypothetical protein
MSTPTPPPPPQRKWDNEQRQAVKDMLAKGATASVVARAFHLTRNQALGRIYRDPEMTLRGYSRPPKISHQPRPPSSKKTARPVSRNVVMVAAAGDVVAAPAAVAPPAPPPEPPKTSANMMALIGTGKRWCKWPVAMDSRVLGGFLCCGARSLPHDVYCQCHRDLAKGVRK